MSPEVLTALREDAAHRRAVVVATHLQTHVQRRILGSDREDPLAEAVATALRTDQPQTLEDEDGSWFLRPYNPALRMVVVGAVHIAQALAPMASQTGYDVVVVDPRTQWATPERFPGVVLHTDWPDEFMEEHPPDARTAVVVLTHDPKIDDPALEASLRSDAFYIGALGSTRTHAKRRQRLTTHHGFTEEQLDRIAGPVGLNIGARTPAEIAVATLAQLTAALRSPA